MCGTTHTQVVEFLERRLAFVEKFKSKLLSGEVAFKMFENGKSIIAKQVS